MINVSCLYAIKSQYRNFSEKEKMIADYILEDPSRVVHPSIEELSETIGISETTLFRFVKKLGYQGYQRFRIALATETVTKDLRIFDAPLRNEDDEVEVVFNSAIATLEQTKNTLNREDIRKAARKMKEARRILLFGMGGSNVVARDAFHKIVRTGLDCTMTDDFHMQLMMASQACQDCVALIISHTGENVDTLAIAQEVRNSGTPILALTSNYRSPLARVADIILPVHVSQVSLVSEAFSARIAQLAIIDVLYVEIMKLLDGQGVDNLEAMRRVIATRRT